MPPRNGGNLTPEPVQTPGDVFPQFGGLEVTTSSTQLQELTDAFIYLYRYQFEFSEQISSRMISIAALRDVLTAFKSKEMPTAAELEEFLIGSISVEGAQAVITHLVHGCETCSFLLSPYLPIVFGRRRRRVASPPTPPEEDPYDGVVDRAFESARRIFDPQPDDHPPGDGSVAPTR